MYSKINKSNLYCHYDHIKQLPIMIFRNVLTEELIGEAHTWLSEIFESVKKQSQLQGLIYDLQEVKRFKSTNLALPQVLIDSRINELPSPVLVNNVYQEHQLRDVAAQDDRKWLVNSYTEAFDFIQSYNSTARGIEQLGLEEHPLILNTEGASVFYDIDKKTLHVTYYGAVTPNVTADVYETMGAVLEKYGVETIRGGIFDFRHISHFENANLTTVRRTSSHLNANYDMSHIAVPLIIGSIIQERMVMVSLKVTPQEERKRIVRSDKEALDFIEEFQAKRLSETGS